MGRPRKLPDGIRLRGGVYHADFTKDGRRIRKRLSSDLGAATEILNDMKARADRADFNLLDNDYSLAELRKQYKRHCDQTLKRTTAARYGRALDAIVPTLAVNRVSQVSADIVLGYRQRRLESGCTPRTVNIDVGALKTMLRWAVDQNLIGSSPLAKLKPLRNDNPKQGRALSDEEVSRLLTGSKQLWRDIWYAFLVTGMRREELASLTFADIDHDSRELIIRGRVAKNHRERRIPIDAGLWEIIQKQEAGRLLRKPGIGKTPKLTQLVQARFSKDCVFVSTQNTPLTTNLYHSFMRCCDRAGIHVQTHDREGRLVEHVDLHSLRRTFATNLIVSGADPKSVQELLGHRTLDMTMRIYAKIHSGTKRQALAKLTYGKGALAPEGVAQYPEIAGRMNGFSGPNCHKSVTSARQAVSV
jgi:integrase